MPDEAPWTDPVVVPDDLRDLAADVEAYHRELRLAGRRRRIDRITSTKVWQRLAFPAAVLVGSLGLAGLVFAVLTFGQPRATVPPVAAPVATAPAAAVGAVHGLLPDVPVRTPDGTVSARSLRPALVALVPAQCGCSRLLATLAAQADEVTLPLVVVAPAAVDAEVAALPGQLHRGRVIPVYDAAGALADTYAAAGVTVLVVAPDATVGYLAADVGPTIRLEGPLQQALTPPPAVTSVSGR
jgi:hypothetical protein